MALALSYFVSYAHKDGRLARSLLDLLEPRLAIVRDYGFSGWIDDRIGIGERWTDEIGAALAACDFGLLLLSPDFFHSGFIRREELPVFLDPIRAADGAEHTRVRKPVVPVMLKDIPLDGSADLAGLDQLQLFRDRDGRSFVRTRGHTRDAFADQLVAAVLAKLRRHFPPTAA